ncbi:hypothetical protein [Porphyromonas sp.]|uniref:Cbp1 family collagen-binding glycoprotein adhesin n=1 Tax=Porphyromonas sp. TaxID=1924944 RepID=UPI0026DD52B0|nr:hypothetical protein [Porphyromonas sp.]MDO4771223.1 hypothetical protein [Porphyromonas sp.]
MKKLNFILVCALVALFTSCGENSSAYKKLQKQYDSLLTVSATADQNLEEMLSIINDVEQSFQDIREAENYVTIKRKSGELNASTREEIRNNMRIFTENLKKSREQLDLLNEELRKNNIKSKSLAAKIKQMTKQLELKEAEMENLRRELASRDIRINELDSTVANLSRNVEDLTHENRQREEIMKRQDNDLNTAYYCFGSVAELKEHKIISGGGLFSSAKVLPEGFNKDYFLSVDIRELTSIPLYAPKARVRTQHPSSSYEFVKDSEGKMTLNILDAKEFWSLSRYLVVEVNL